MILIEFSGWYVFTYVPHVILPPTGIHRVATARASAKLFSLQIKKGFSRPKSRAHKNVFLIPTNALYICLTITKLYLCNKAEKKIFLLHFYENG
jgi:hypothetical protein